MAPDAEVSPKTKKPSDSAFKQQRLPAWQPILTAGTVLPTFFVIGIAFIPVGIGLLYFSDEVKEIIIDYTNCNQTNVLSKSASTFTYEVTSKTCAEIISQNTSSEPCYCRIDFELKDDFKGEVYMYYGLSNYYQNHRRYVKSRDDLQLLGTLETPSSDCEPFAYDVNGSTKMRIAPCGAVANSMFNDVLWIDSTNHKTSVPLLRTGIAWNSDKKRKFQNPPHETGKLEEAFKDFVKPKAWKKNVWELDPEDESNNGFLNEDFIVWMRTAALPTFRKLYRRIDHEQAGFRDGLTKGTYTLHVNYSYDVSAFAGSKRMILSTTSLLGGKNPFLGIAYIVVGCICLLLGIALLFIHIKCGKSTTEMINVNPRTPYQ